MITQVTHDVVAKDSKTFVFPPVKSFGKPYFENSSVHLIWIDWALLNLILFSILNLNLVSQSALNMQMADPTIFMIVANIGWLILSFSSDTYWIIEDDKLNIREHFYTTTLYFGVLSLVYYQFFFQYFQIHFLLNAFLIYLVVSVVVHAILRLHYNPTRNSSLNYAIVGGTQKQIDKILEVIQTLYGKHTALWGRFGDGKIGSIANLGDYTQISEYLVKGYIDKLYYIDSNLTNHELSQLSSRCRNYLIEFEVIPKEVDVFKKGLQIKLVGGLPVFGRKKEPLRHIRNKALKRLFDIIFSIVVILTIYPWLFPFIAILIRLESRGPIFFLQERTGYWNKPFMMIKFRTMTVNQDSDSRQATKGDYRITRVGNLLRKTSLDELPQFINVLKGEMSVVGPRPHMLKHTEDYAKIIESYMIRHEVKPGVTGWAQVNGWRGPTNSLFKMIKRVEYDVNYIENWNLWFDYKCICLTLINMIKGEQNAV
ncbi:MAG: exopolysaccharide biosynthesis polyprenyl glycosylphosphotransferase [Saprospiraceae bacterium]|nr:exopolysaccharide biosynthesis polyprenyl glycosylphosphotransferase [Saprospiraceae bacterium]